MSEARRAENNELIKEMGVLWEERQRAMRKTDPPDFDEQEEWDQEDYEYLRYELEAEEEYEQLLHVSVVHTCLMFDVASNHE